MTSAVDAAQAWRARSFLNPRRAALYGARPVLFDLEKSYRDFDAMQKRRIFYARFGVREVLAEARAGSGNGRLVLRVHDRAGFASDRGASAPGATPQSGGIQGGTAQGGLQAFGDYLRSRRLLPAPGGPRKRIPLDGRIHELDVSHRSPDCLELRLVPQPGGPLQGLRVSTRSLQADWFQSLLTDWAGTGPYRLDGGPISAARSASGTATKTAAESATGTASGTDTWSWIVSRRISEVDVDISGEETPHVFRWKELSLARASTFADLDDADIGAALASAGTTLPPNAHLQGRLQEELGQRSACLLLRYAHLLTDPDRDAGGDEAAVPPRLSPGAIVMENDYLEILIDGRTGKVFSESRKWRPEPGGSVRAPENRLRE